MRSLHDRYVDSPAGTMAPFQLLSYYVDLANLQSEDGYSYTTLPSYLMFTSEGEGFLIPVENISSVIREKPIIKPLPFSPDWFEGLSSVRNEIVSVISFSQLYTGKTGNRREDVHYILLGGAANGFMLKVDELIGVKSLSVKEDFSKDKLIDGHVIIDGKRWSRISLDVMLATKLQKKLGFKQGSLK